MEWLVGVGVAIAVGALAAVLWLRWRRRPEAGADQTKAPPRAAWTRSEVISVAGIVVGAALSLAGLLSDGGPGPEAEPSPAALAALLRQGPFSKSLPEGLEVIELQDASIGDSSAAGRVDALELVIDTEDAPSDLGVYAHLEVYPSSEAATRRANERIALLKRVFDADTVEGDASSYCSAGTIHGPTAWECGGASGLVYAEATVYPNSNALQPVATGIASAILSYADEKAQIAAG